MEDVQPHTLTVQLEKPRPRAGRDELQVALQVRGGQARAPPSRGRSKLRPISCFFLKGSLLHPEARDSGRGQSLKRRDGG